MKPIFFDTETTGIRFDKDAIIEIAAYDLSKNESFVSLINPMMPIPEEATAIHQITDEMVKDAPSFQEVGNRFISFCGEDAVLIAHNMDKFDKPFLVAESKKHGLVLPDTWKYLDSLVWARRYRPDLPRHSLQSLRELFGIPANQAHRALDDVMILKKVFELMTDDLPIETIFELLTASRKISVMPFGKYKGVPIETIPKDYLKWLQASGAFDKEENADLKEAFSSKGLL